MSSKKSFILHIDSLEILDKLSDEQAGQLIKAIYNYQLNGVVNELDILIEIAITPFLKQFDRDNEAYNKMVDKNKENGKKGGRPKKPKQTQEKPENPVGYLGYEEKPKKADNDNVNDNGSVNKNDNVNINDNLIREICNFAWYLFPEDLRPKKADKKWYDTIDKLIRIDNKNPDEIKSVIRWARTNDFWKSQFLSLTKLRTKKDNVRYYERFNELRKNDKTNSSKHYENGQRTGDPFPNFT